jgi:hypothetical protein
MTTQARRVLHIVHDGSISRFFMAMASIVSRTIDVGRFHHAIGGADQHGLSGGVVDLGEIEPILLPPPYPFPAMKGSFF